MKDLRELKFEELSIDQKLGMVMAGIITTVRPHERDIYGTYEENLEFVLELVRNHSLGGVWVTNPMIEKFPDIMPKLKEAADYPLLIFTDAESGLGDHKVGRHNAIGIADSEELAYIFGKVTAINARKRGYNVVCDPVIDMTDRSSPCSGNNRSMGSDKYRVTALAAAMARGLHDGGVLTVAKHFPGGYHELDTHMVPVESTSSLEEMIDYYLYPYQELSKMGLIDGLMKGHSMVPSIDPDYPISVSMKSSELIRSLGFDGFMITDALDMMGLRARYGDEKLKGMCIAGGNEFILPFFSAKKAYRDLKTCYEEGMIPDDVLDAAVKRVLAAQHKAALYLEPKFTEITEEDERLFDEINKSCVYAVLDEGVSPSISRDGKHFFSIMVSNALKLDSDGKILSNDSFTIPWLHPDKVQAKIKELFPNSRCQIFYEQPLPRQNADVLSYSLNCDESIFITYGEAPASSGSDRFTPRVLALMKAMEMTGRYTTQVHFGNPFVLEEAPHAKRRLIGCTSEDCVSVALDILAGNLEPKGHPTYKAKLP